MNFLKLVPITCLVLFIGMSISSCDGKSSNSNAAETGKEYTSAYICPMHCDGSGSDAPGTCPVCGMDYEKNQDASTQEESHDGHDHGDHDGHNH